MKTISVKLPEPLAEWLEGEAEQSRRSRSQIVREALEQRRDGPGIGRARKRRSMAEAMADLGGFFDGPPDLSTNPEYFDDFGK